MKLLISATNRADIGHLMPLIEKSGRHSKIELTILLNEIRHKLEIGELIQKNRNGFKFNLKHFRYVRLNDNPKSQLAIIQSIIGNLKSYFSKNSFDFAVVLGDRFETSIISQILFEFNIYMVVKIQKAHATIFIGQ
jgi:UDP-N-acetylglucosamine 2-epimerase